MVQLACYPPDHSKYDLIERCCGVQELHGDGSPLDWTDAAPGHAGSMTGKGKSPVVVEVETIDATGVRLRPGQMEPW